MADIPDGWTAEGWLFCATIEDLDRRMMVGWAMGARLSPDRVLRALDQAVHRYQPPLKPADAHTACRPASVGRAIVTIMRVASPDITSSKKAQLD
jgi:transposase InsO family protein